MKGKVTSFPLLLMLAMGILIINCDNSGSGSIFGSLGDKEKAEKRATARSSKQDSNSKEIYTSLYIAGFTYIPEGSFYPAEGFGKMTVSPFYIGKYEITRAEYYNIMGEKPWLLDAYDPYPLSDVYNEEDIERLPCTGMNWFEAVVF
ncbi:MAG: hypothetical protein FWF38_04955, partial [Spirochaetaceae bacterium]|nr:hypothetical protein [Spirochaetaceae bacterium]